MPLLLLLILALACWPQRWALPWPGCASAWICLDLPLALIVAQVAAAAYISRRLVHCVARQPDDRHAWARTYHKLRRLHYYSLFPLYGVTLYGLGWGWAVQSMLPGADNQDPSLSPLGELLVIMPFLAALIGSWAFYFDAERALYLASQGPEAPLPWLSRWSYVGFQSRQTLGLICAPVVLLVVQKGLILPFSRLPIAWEWIASLMGILAAVVVLLTQPLLWRLVLGLKPFPAGALRDRLLATGRRLNIRFSKLMLWDTRGNVANAMVAGLVPFSRYIVLSDRLIKDLSEDEVEAVFGHEAGHVYHWHMVLYLAFFFLSMTVLGALLLPGIESWFSGRQDLQMVPFIVLMGAYTFVFFGFLSRRCERQADVYGCRAVSCNEPNCEGHGENTALTAKGRGLCPTGIRTFISALEKVADSNGMSRDRPGWLLSWLHSTIALRVKFLERVRNNPSVEKRFQRRIGLVKWALFLGLVAALLSVGQFLGWQNLQVGF